MIPALLITALDTIEMAVLAVPVVLFLLNADAVFPLILTVSSTSVVGAPNAEKDLPLTTEFV